MTWRISKYRISQGSDAYSYEERRLRSEHQAEYLFGVIMRGALAIGISLILVCHSSWISAQAAAGSRIAVDGRFNETAPAPDPEAGMRSYPLVAMIWRSFFLHRLEPLWAQRTITDWGVSCIMSAKFMPSLEALLNSQLKYFAAFTNTLTSLKLLACHLSWLYLPKIDIYHRTVNTDSHESSQQDKAVQNGTLCAGVSSSFLLSFISSAQKPATSDNTTAPLRLVVPSVSASAPAQTLNPRRGAPGPAPGSSPNPGPSPSPNPGPGPAPARSPSFGKRHLLQDSFNIQNNANIQCKHHPPPRRKGRTSLPHTQHPPHSFSVEQRIGPLGKVSPDTSRV